MQKVIKKKLLEQLNYDIETSHIYYYINNDSNFFMLTKN